MTVRVLGKSATVGYAAQNNKSINARLQQLVDAHTHILLPINTFDHNEEHLAFVFDELVGPDLYYLTQIGAQGCGQPANWIQKVFREALQALDILHSGNIVHGSQSMSSASCQPSFAYHLRQCLTLSLS